MACEKKELFSDVYEELNAHIETCDGMSGSCRDMMLENLAKKWGVDFAP